MKKEQSKKEQVITKEIAYRNILEWLYVNEGTQSLTFKEHLLNVIEWNIKHIKYGNHKRKTTQTTRPRA